MDVVGGTFDVITLRLRLLVELDLFKPPQLGVNLFSTRELIATFRAIHQRCMDHSPTHNTIVAFAWAYLERRLA